MLHTPEGFDCDLTYGNGAFWTRQPKPKYCYDIDPQARWISNECSTAIKHDDETLGNIMFDPPFLTYVRSGRGGNGRMIMSRRFGGYWTYGELEDHYRKTLAEAARVMRRGAKLVFKCQDIVHNHALHPTHINVVAWAEECGLRLKDQFVLIANHRLPAPNRKGTQKHARIFHSYFLVFEKRPATRRK
jgi:hypothetical protein